MAEETEGISIEVLTSCSFVVTEDDVIKEAGRSEDGKGKKGGKKEGI